MGGEGERFLKSDFSETAGGIESGGKLWRAQLRSFQPRGQKSRLKAAPTESIFVLNVISLHFWSDLYELKNTHK